MPYLKKMIYINKLSFGERYKRQSSAKGPYFSSE